MILPGDRVAECCIEFGDVVSGSVEGLHDAFVTLCKFGTGRFVAHLDKSKYLLVRVEAKGDAQAFAF